MPNNSPADVLEVFLDSCARSSDPLLGCLVPDENVFEAPAEPDAVSTSLSKRFSREDLLASGVLEETTDGRLQVAPALTAHRFLALLDVATSRPYEILTQAGCVSRRVIPVFAILDDRFTQVGLNQSEDLFVAFDIEDVLLLRACGLSATLGTGLADLPLSEVERFRKWFEMPPLREIADPMPAPPGLPAPPGFLSPRRSSRPVGTPIPSSPQVRRDPFRQPAPDGPRTPVVESVRLTFVAWLPSTLTCAIPRPLKPVSDCLHEFQRFLDLELCELGLWSPTDETLAQLNFLARRQSGPLFREALRGAATGMQDTIQDFAQEPPPRPQLPASYPAALARFLEVDSASGSLWRLGREEKQRAWDSIVRYLNQQVLQPIRESALASSDPLEQILLLCLADVSQEFQLDMARMAERRQQELKARGLARMESPPEKDTKHLFGLADRLLQVIKEIRQCQQISQPFAPQPISISAPPLPRLPDSA